jgi:hypothetical protein
MMRQLGSWNTLSLFIPTLLLLLVLASNQLVDCWISSVVALTTNSRVSRVTPPSAVTFVARTTTAAASVTSKYYNRSSSTTPWTIKYHLSKDGKNEDNHPIHNHNHSNNNHNNNNNNDDNNSFFLLLQERYAAADVLEIRLDATLVACHVLARFLVYDLTLHKVKEVPGIEVTDAIQLLDTFTSATVLAVLWIFVGLMVTRLFEDASSWKRLVGTTALAAPVWLVLELVLHWPAAPSSSGIEHVLVGSLGVLGTMSLGRLVPAHLK